MSLCRTLLSSFHLFRKRGAVVAIKLNPDVRKTPRVNLLKLLREPTALHAHRGRKKRAIFMERGE